MKDYQIVLSSVKSKIKYHPKDFAMGYIYALLDWRVINQETYERLEILVKKGDLTSMTKTLLT